MIDGVGSQVDHRRRIEIGLREMLWPQIDSCGWVSPITKSFFRPDPGCSRQPAFLLPGRTHLSKGWYCEWQNQQPEDGSPIHRHFLSGYCSILPQLGTRCKTRCDSRYQSESSFRRTWITRSDSPYLPSPKR